jgi:tRNA nucleotidyltransferase/poly(A) polymerase
MLSGSSSVFTDAQDMIKIDSDLFPKTNMDGAYIVGGSIRDLLIGRSPTDYDVAVLKNPYQWAQKIAAHTSGRLVEIGKPGKMVIRVVTRGIIIDITPVNGNTIEDDLSQRDFTINALGYSIADGHIIDCLGGLRDLNARKVRMVSKAVFKKDPIRLIRAHRMSASLNFEIEMQTLTAIQDNAKRLLNTAGERIRNEFIKILETPNSHEHLLRMAETGLLQVLLPELDKTRNCFQNRHHLDNVYDHTLKAFAHLEKLIEKTNTDIPESSGLPPFEVDASRTIFLKLAILLHDVGKPDVQTMDNHGRIHFYGHAQKSAAMAQRICRRLKLSNCEKGFIDFIISNHLRPLHLFVAQQTHSLTRKGRTRFFMKVGDLTPYLLLHALADMCAKGSGGNERYSAFLDFTANLYHQFISDFRPRQQEPPLITGHDLIDAFGLQPSPAFKPILNSVQEARLARTLSTREQALKWVEKLITRQGLPKQKKSLGSSER